MPRKLFFLDVDFKKSKCLLEGKSLEVASDFAFDHYQIIQESIKRIQGVWTESNLPLSVRGALHRCEATELVNLINPGRPIVSNNFLVKFENLWKKGVKRVPKKTTQDLSPKTVDRARWFYQPSATFL